MDAEQLDRLVRDGKESYNRRDPELLIAQWDPECEWHPFFSAQVEGAAGYSGHEGLRQWFRDTDEMFSEVSWQVDEVRDLGDERILILGRLEARGRQSGAEVQSPIGQLYELRDGRILRGWAYPSHAEARQAGGVAS